jgi:LacI family transcriptional regulator
VSAAEHLLTIGRKRPLVITGVPPFGCTLDRSAGFAQPFAEAGLALDESLVFEGDFTFDRGREVVKQSLEKGTQFDAVFAHNDLSAAGAMSALREAGLRVPEDVAVVGFDDIPLASHTDPPLTTVHQPMRLMGETAARLLLSHLDGSPLPLPPTIIPTTLIVRGSTVPP